MRADSQLSNEKTLFAAADKMRGSLDAGEYRHIALGLLFLRYVSISFVRLHDNATANSWFERPTALSEEKQTLATRRDTLKPLLMSGELRVGASREMMEEVAKW